MHEVHGLELIFRIHRDKLLVHKVLHMQETMHASAIMHMLAFGV